MKNAGSSNKKYQEIEEFYTRQEHVSLATRQRELWKTIILSHAAKNSVHTVDLIRDLELAPFFNDQIKRGLTIDFATEIFTDMEDDYPQKAIFLDSGKTKVLLLWSGSLEDLVSKCYDAILGGTPKNATRREVASVTSEEFAAIVGKAIGADGPFLGDLSNTLFSRFAAQMPRFLHYEDQGSSASGRLHAFSENYLLSVVKKASSELSRSVFPVMHLGSVLKNMDKREVEIVRKHVMSQGYEVFGDNALVRLRGGFCATQGGIMGLADTLNAHSDGTSIAIVNADTLCEIMLNTKKDIPHEMVNYMKNLGPTELFKGFHILPVDKHASHFIISKVNAEEIYRRAEDFAKNHAPVMAGPMGFLLNAEGYVGLLKISGLVSQSYDISAESKKMTSLLGSDFVSAGIKRVLSSHDSYKGAFEFKGLLGIAFKSEDRINIVDSLCKNFLEIYHKIDYFGNQKGILLDIPVESYIGMILFGSKGTSLVSSVVERLKTFDSGIMGAESYQNRMVYYGKPGGGPSFLFHACLRALWRRIDEFKAEGMRFSAQELSSICMEADIKMDIECFDWLCNHPDVSATKNSMASVLAVLSKGEFADYDSLNWFPDHPYSMAQVDKSLGHVFVPKGGFAKMGFDIRQALIERWKFDPTTRMTFNIQEIIDVVNTPPPQPTNPDFGAPETGESNQVALPSGNDTAAPEPDNFVSIPSVHSISKYQGVTPENVVFALSCVLGPVTTDFKVITGSASLERECHEKINRHVSEWERRYESKRAIYNGCAIDVERLDQKNMDDVYWKLVMRSTYGEGRVFLDGNRKEFEQKVLKLVNLLQGIFVKGRKNATYDDTHKVASALSDLRVIQSEWEKNVVNMTSESMVVQLNDDSKSLKARDKFITACENLFSEAADGVSEIMKTATICIEEKYKKESELVLEKIDALTPLHPYVQNSDERMREVSEAMKMVSWSYSGNQVHVNIKGTPVFSETPVYYAAMSVAGSAVDRAIQKIYGEATLHIPIVTINALEFYRTYFFAMDMQNIISTSQVDNKN